MNVKINGINLYYEKIGCGAPLLFLHGNGENHTVFSKAAEMMKERFTCYLLDTRAHGKSEKAPLHYADMARDVAGFIKQMNLKKVYVLGFSDGGITALLLAIHNPELLCKAVVCGANVSPDGLKSRYLLPMKVGYFFSRSPLLRLMISEPNISAGELASVAVPIAVYAGEFDMVKESHTEMIAASIKGATLRIMKGETHGSYVLDEKKLCQILTESFDNL